MTKLFDERQARRAAEAEVERLKAQLPAEMQSCTIFFKECPKGHGELSAKNWMQHDCQICRAEAAEAKLAEYEVVVQAAQGLPEPSVYNYEYMHEEWRKLREALAKLKERTP